MWGKAKPTPAAIRKTASRIIRVGAPLDEGKLREKLRAAILAVDPMVPINHPDKHNLLADRFIDAIAPVLQPLFDDLHALAGHAVGDE